MKHCEPAEFFLLSILNTAKETGGEKEEDVMECQRKKKQKSRLHREKNESTGVYTQKQI